MESAWNRPRLGRFCLRNGGVLVVVVTAGWSISHAASELPSALSSQHPPRCGSKRTPRRGDVPSTKEENEHSKLEDNAF
eukprot:2612546-Prymnesium_polylepis.1